MNRCLMLSDPQAIGGDVEFLEQVTKAGLGPSWTKFRDRFRLSGIEGDSDSLDALGRLFCHMNGLVVMAGGSVLLAKIPKRNGYVARYSDLEGVLQELSMQEAWDGYFIGCTFCLLDEDGLKQQKNWAIFCDAM